MQKIQTNSKQKITDVILKISRVKPTWINHLRKILTTFAICFVCHMAAINYLNYAYKRPGRAIIKHKAIMSFVVSFRALLYDVSVYIGDEPVEEPDFQYIPDTHHISSSVPHGDALAGSLMLLQEGLESGAVLAQFEVRF